MAWLRVPGWFGKFRDLESVAFTPINSPNLMNRKTSHLIAELSKIPAYRRLFAEAFEEEYDFEIPWDSFTKGLGA